MVNSMNEAIGEKGGRRDRKRTIIITSENKKKLKEYYKKKKELKLQKLEKKVRNIQLASFFVAVPISIAGNTFETILHLRDENKTEREQAKGLQTEELHKANKLELQETATYIEDFQLNDRKFTDYGYPKTIEGKEVISYPRIDIKETITKKTPPKEVSSKISLEKNKEELERQEIKQEILIEEKKKVEVKEEKQTEISIPKQVQVVDQELAENKEFQKVTDKKIVAKYESDLKDIRGELKGLIYEYNVLAKDTEKVHESKEAENILYQLNIIIKRLEQLKSKMKIEANSLEDAYLTEVVNQYIEEFKNKNTVAEIKDSDLYIMISDKLEEVTSKAKTLNKNVEEKKENLELDEEKFSQLKENYYNYENFNNQLIAFQNEQDYMLKELESKIEDSVNITEQVTYSFRMMNRQSKRLRNLLAIPMLIPGARSAKAVATATAAYLLFAKNLVKPRLQEKKYRIIEVKDYSKEIESNISKIEEAINMISKTSNKLEEMISNIEKNFKDYIDELPECRELLDNLNKLLDDMKAKAEELERTKQAQNKLLEHNNQKVKTMPRTEEM